MTTSIITCQRALASSKSFLLATAVATSLCVAQQGPDSAHAVPTNVGSAPAESLPAVALATPDATPQTRPAGNDPLIPIHTSTPDQGAEYGIWAAGPKYKVSFHDGATFVPLLGKSYPHNQPVTWRTNTVTVGYQELATQEPQLHYDELRAEYDLGGIIEAYDIRTDGVEQTFVLAQRPAQSGDLVIRGVVESMLRANNAAPAHQELQFVDDQGKHLFTYGKATAIDANGNRRTMLTSHEHGQVTLRLDGDWLSQAAFPIVVDPLLGPGTQLGGDPREEIDVVRTSEHFIEAVWMGYSVYASAADRDVYLVRYMDAGQVGPGVFADVSANWSSQGARVAYVAGADRAVVVYDRVFFSSGARLLRYHRHDEDDPNFNSAVWSIATNGHAWRCDVGGTETGTGTEALVVFQREPAIGAFANSNTSDIYGCLVDLTSSAGASFVITNAASQDQERPSVNQVATGNANDSWRVAYQTLSTGVIGGQDDWDIAVKRVDLFGNSSAPLFIDGGSSDHKFAPIIEGQGNRYLVMFTATPTTSAFPTGINGEQIRAVRVDWTNGAPMGTQPWGTAVIQNNNDPRLELAGLGYDRDTDSHWVTMFRSNVTQLIYLRTLGHRGQLLQSATVFNPIGNDESVRGAVSFDHTGPQFILAYGNNGSSDFVTMDRWEHTSVSSWSTSGSACSPASIEWQGSQLIGNEFGHMRVLGAANDSIHALVLADATASFQFFNTPPIQDSCWLLVPSAGPNHFGILDLKIGANPEWNVPLPESLSDDTFYFQGFHTVGNGNLDFVSTQRLALPVAR